MSQYALNNWYLQKLKPLPSSVIAQLSN